MNAFGKGRRYQRAGLLTFLALSATWPGSSVASPPYSNYQQCVADHYYSLDQCRRQFLGGGGGGVSALAVAGIVIGGLILVAGGFWLIHRRRIRTSAPPAAPSVGEPLRASSNRFDGVVLAVPRLVVFGAAVLAILAVGVIATLLITGGGEPSSKGSDSLSSEQHATLVNATRKLEHDIDAQRLITHTHAAASRLPSLVGRYYAEKSTGSPAEEKPCSDRLRA